MDGVGFEAVDGQEPEGEGAAEGPAEFLGHAAGGEYEAGGAASGCPLGVVGGIGVHRPQQGEDDAGAEADEGLQAVNEQEVAFAGELEYYAEGGGGKHGEHKGAALAEEGGYGLGHDDANHVGGLT